MSEKTEMSDAVKKELSLDRRVNLGLVAALLIQAATFVWGASSINSQVKNQQKELDNHAGQIASMYIQQAGVGERLARMEAGLEAQNKTLDRIEDAVREKEKK